MIRMISFVAAAVLLMQPAHAALDPKSRDAVAAFGDLCVGLFTGNKRSDFDPTRFSFTKINEKTAREIKPDVNGPL